MSINTENITVGLGNLELGEYSGASFLGYSDIGAIKGEVNIEHTREVLDFESGRPLVVLKQEVIRESVTVAVSLAELSVATLKMALGQGSISSGTTTSFLDGSTSVPYGTTTDQTKTAIGNGNLFKFGGTPTHAYVGLRFTHRKANGKRIIFEGYKASPQGTLAIPFRETDWALNQVTFRLLADITKTAGEQYYQLLIEQ